MWKSVDALLGGLPGSDEERAAARQLATLPMRLGGLGMRSASRTAVAASWAPWADALPMLVDNVIQEHSNASSRI